MTTPSLTTNLDDAFKQATRLLEGASRVLIVAHINPDGDAIGSLLGLANAIRPMGKDVTCAVDGGVPAYLRFLPAQETVLPQLKTGDWDLVIFTDCGDQERGGAVGEWGAQHSTAIINIDHHPTNPRFGNVPIVLDTVASASEIVFMWWQFMGLPYGHEVAMPLLTGIVTDTQGFRTSATNAQTLETAMHLIQHGASLAEATARTLDTKSTQEFNLWKRILPNATIDGEVAIGVVLVEDVKAVGLSETTDADLVQLLVNIDEVRVAVVFKEREVGKISVSLRAKQGYNVAEVASKFGGGGHVQAAGVTMKGSLEEVRNLILPLLHEATQKGTLKIG